MVHAAFLSLLPLFAQYTSLPVPDDASIVADLTATTTRKAKTFGSYGQKIKATRDPLVTSFREKQHYNPHFGYEPYWANGEWLIRDPIKDLGPNETTPRIPLVCGEECNYIYQRIGQVCAYQPDKYWLNSCYYAECYGDALVDMTNQYKTFDSYCAFLNAQCRDDYYGKWSMIHRGPCVRPTQTYFKPIINGTVLLERKDAYLATMKQNLAQVPTRKRKG